MVSKIASKNSFKKLKLIDCHHISRMKIAIFLWILFLGVQQKTRALLEDYTTVTGGFSGKNDDATSRANCPAGYLLTGCTLNNWYKTDGRRVNDDLSHGCIGQNGGGGNGLKVS